MAKKDKAAKGTKTGRSTMVVDFTKDTSDGGRRRFKEGDYKVKIVKTSTGKSSQKGTPFVQLDLEFIEDKYKGEKISDRCYITDKALWRIRSVYEALGKTVPKRKVTLDFSKLVGGVLAITVGDDSYDKDGKTKVISRVTDYLDPDDISEEDDEDEDEDEDDEEDEDLESMDVDDDL